MMNNQLVSRPSKQKQEDNPLQALAAQFQMTEEETSYIVNIVQENDPSLELLKQPRVLMLIKQRKGRWVKEEEEFATFLSEEFLLGLSDIAHGTTRRAYLSSKLACTKMRISKKFKGQSTGKEVFTRRERQEDGQILSPQEIYYYRQTHIELEKKFLKSVLKSVIKGSLRNSKKKTNQLPQCPPMGMQNAAQNMQMATSSWGRDSTDSSPANDIEPIQKTETRTSGTLQNLLGNGQLNPGFQAGSASSGSTVNTQLKGPTVIGGSTGTGVQPLVIAHQDVTSIVIPSQPVAMANPIQHVPNQIDSLADSTMQVPSGVPVNMFYHTNGGMPTTFPLNVVENPARAEAWQPPQLHGLNMNIHMNSHMNNQNMNNYIGYQSNMNDTQRYLDGQMKHHITSDVTGSTGHTFPPLVHTGGAKRFKHIPAASASQAVSTSASEPSSNDESENVPSSNETSCYSYGRSTGGTVKSEHHCKHNDIPDLLSGFDKHVASMKKSTTTIKTDTANNRPIPEDSHLFAGAGGIGESPYITSKSFDELHQFLGKGLSSDKLHNNPEPTDKYSNISHLNLNENGNRYHPVIQNPCHKSAGADASRQTGPPLSFGAFFSQVTHVPGSIMDGPNFNAQHIARPTSTSNTSDLTASD